MDENISVMNRYTELYYVSVWNLVYKAQQTVCQLQYYNTYRRVKITYSIQYINMLYRFVT